MRFVVKYIFKQASMLLSPDPTITFTNLTQRAYVDAYEKFLFSLNIELFHETDIQDEILENVKIGSTGIVEWFISTVTSFKRLYLNLPQFHM